MEIISLIVERLIVERKTGPSYVSDNNLRTALIDAYGAEKASLVLEKIDNLMMCSTRLPDGIYPHDLSAIFYRLKIPVKFIGESGLEINVNKKGSGVLW